MVLHGCEKWDDGWAGVGMGKKQYKIYREALKSVLTSVMNKLSDEYYG